MKIEQISNPDGSYRGLTYKSATSEYTDTGGYPCAVNSMALRASWDEVDPKDFARALAEAFGWVVREAKEAHVKVGHNDFIGNEPTSQA